MAGVVTQLVYTFMSQICVYYIYPRTSFIVENEERVYDDNYDDDNDNDNDDDNDNDVDNDNDERGAR